MIAGHVQLVLAFVAVRAVVRGLLAPVAEVLLVLQLLGGRSEADQFGLGDLRCPAVAEDRLVDRKFGGIYNVSRLRPVRTERLPQVEFFACTTVRQQIDRLAVQERHFDGGRIDRNVRWKGERSEERKKGNN